MLLTTADVAGRFLFNKPILGTIELTEIFVLIIVFSFLAHTQAQKGHISVDLFVNRFPGPVRLGVELAGSAICLVLMGLIVWMSGIMTLELKQTALSSNNLHIPKYPLEIFVMIGGFVMCVEYLRDLLIATKEILKKKGRAL
ncbi:MAG: TRAP transporter small permease [Desulfobacteraceae bacterium]|jgi:TRAP-type C4-dicarboxylate transport system permease small subunit